MRTWTKTWSPLARPEDARDAVRHVAQWWGNAVLVSERDGDVELTADDMFPESN
jgi:hypothetical protein